jgi:hypothetical protein
MSSSIHDNKLTALLPKSKFDFSIFKEQDTHNKSKKEGIQDILTDLRKLWVWCGIANEDGADRVVRNGIRDGLAESAYDVHFYIRLR